MREFIKSPSKVTLGTSSKKEHLNEQGEIIPESGAETVKEET